MTIDMCNNMNESQNNYVAWKMADKKGHAVVPLM